MKTKSGKRVFAIIAVILFALIAVIVPIFTMAKGMNANAEIVNNPPNEETAQLDNVTITIPSNATSVVSQQQLYFETKDSSGGWSIVKFKFNKTLNFSNTFISFYYAMFNGSTKMSMSWFLNGKETAWLDVPINNQNTVPYDYFDTTYSQFAPHLQGTQYNEVGIRLYYGSPSPAWFQLFTLTVAKKDFSEITVKYKSYIYDIITKTNEQNYSNGYHNGYVNGYDKGVVANINPISAFIKPIDTFMNTPIFGTLTIGTIISVLLFIMIALIFLKMFAGG